MAKSTRSKVKRSYRRDKREIGASAYHAADVARLARLSAKLRSKFEDAPAIIATDSTEKEMRDADEDGSPAGWLEFAIFGLIDQDSISFASS